jgi:alkanesulfonate monooxygenase SsuD/methylene tetrahydromethanopterin reductase-like flavin-dependent oxidoreductase (luciferase family)
MIRVGTTVRPQHGDFAQMRETWLRAEDMGADTLFVWDHFFPLSSSGRSCSATPTATPTSSPT